jgi:hypothetical protein
VLSFISNGINSLVRSFFVKTEQISIQKRLFLIFTIHSHDIDTSLDLPEVDNQTNHHDSITRNSTGVGSRPSFYHHKGRGHCLSGTPSHPLMIRFIKTSGEWHLQHHSKDSFSALIAS